MLGGLGLPELIIILAIVLLLFGSKKLPELGESVGKTIKGFKKGMEDGQADAESKKADDTKTKE